VSQFPLGHLGHPVTPVSERFSRSSRCSTLSAQRSTVFSITTEARRCFYFLFCSSSYNIPSIQPLAHNHGEYTTRVERLRTRPVYVLSIVSPYMPVFKSFKVVSDPGCEALIYSALPMEHFCRVCHPLRPSEPLARYWPVLLRC
jgi:hypothetical protein